MAQLQTRRRSATFSVVISSSGLCAWASSVRRQFNQSAGDGFWSIASVTGVKSVTWAAPGEPASSSAAETDASSVRVMRVSLVRLIRTVRDDSR